MLHAPFFSEETHGTTPARVWAQLEALHKDGRARAIGVSNFSVSHLEKLLKTAKIVPAVNQIELHPQRVATRSSTASRGPPEKRTMGASGP